MHRAYPNYLFSCDAIYFTLLLSFTASHAIKYYLSRGNLANTCDLSVPERSETPTEDIRQQSEMVGGGDAPIKGADIGKVLRIKMPREAEFHSKISKQAQIVKA